MIMNRIKCTLVALASFFSVSVAMAGSDVLRMLPFPVKWSDNYSVVMMQRGSQNGVTTYNVKSGDITPFTGDLNEVTVPTVSIVRGDIIYKPVVGESIVLTTTPEQEMNPILSPDYKYVAFTRGNDLYTIEVATKKEFRYTFDGTDVIMNGRASWVYYEEIFGRATDYCAFWWSPDSKRIAFYRFDDSKVPVFPITGFEGKGGSLLNTRYPKAGDENPEVKLGFVQVGSADIKWADFDERQDQYMGTPYWNNYGEGILVQWMDRDQSNFFVYMVNPDDGSKRVVYKEFQKSWVDWLEEVRFGESGFYMVRDFELWEQIYFQPYDGGKLIRLTEGNNWGIKLINLDEKSREIDFICRREVSTRNDVYTLSWKKGWKNSNVSRLSSGDYNYATAIFSPDRSKFVSVRSNISTPNQIVCIDRRGAVREMFNSKGDDFDSANLPVAKMLTITTPDGYRLPASVIWPMNMDTTGATKYPVIVSMYGGPNSGTVMDRWRSPGEATLLWANSGVIQINIDHRASGHCGKEGMNFIHRNLGKVELEDYILWVKYLLDKPFVDGQKIGITGFSFGGTMTALALTKGAEYFKFGIAGGGVYDWLLYDSHYTERYMDHPKDNPEGYKSSAVKNFASLYRPQEGSLLRITHGSADDNVHMQNTMQFVYELQKEGKHFELMIYPGGKHGYRGAQGVHSASEDTLFWKKVFNIK